MEQFAFRRAAQIEQKGKVLPSMQVHTQTFRSCLGIPLMLAVGALPSYLHQAPQLVLSACQLESQPVCPAETYCCLRAALRLGQVAVYRLMQA
jgi:hypothetical protein